MKFMLMRDRGGGGEGKGRKERRRRDAGKRQVDWERAAITGGMRHCGRKV